MKKHRNVYGTREWARINKNFVTGCEHGCLYCYSREMATRYGWKDAGDWNNQFIRQKDLEKKIKLYNEPIMFPSSHDITPSILEESIRFLRNLLVPGNRVLIVSKPHYECIRRICDELENYKDKILFRFTIGSTSDKVLSFWEPNAPSFKERLKSLKYAFNKGYHTSISCEPMLDNHIERVIKKVEPYVTETIWLGKANRFLGKTGRGRLEFNGILNSETRQKAEQLIKWQSDDNIMKLYEKYKNNPMIRFKESINHVLGKKGIIIN